MRFSKIDPLELEGNVFDMIGKQWMLITAGNKEGYNTMTASWGGLGVLWSLNVATAYVRPQRYTFEFIEKSEIFTLSFFEEKYRPQLTICGSKSGRDIDKTEQCGFSPVFSEEGGVYFDEASTVLLCRKLYFNDLDPRNFLDSRIENHYPGKDYHRLYVGEILDILRKD